MNTDAAPLRLRLAASVASGATLSLAFAPADQRWIAFVAVAPLLWAIRGARPRSAFTLGLAAGLPFFGIQLWWISAFGTLPWVLLVAAQAAFLGVFAVALALAWRRVGWVAAPVLWAALEILRFRWPLGGFTWGGLGYSQAGGGAVVHLARWGGVLLVGMAVVAVNALIVEALRTPATRARMLVMAAFIVIAPAAIPLGLAGPETGTIDVAAVQGNVPRGRFGQIGSRIGPEDITIVENHIRVTERLLGGAAPDLIVWPENSLDRDPRAYPDLFARVQNIVDRVGAPLLAGGILDADEPDRFVNANLLIEPLHGITQRYDKLHLVPFGEYVPWRWARRLVPILDQEIPNDGKPGDRIVLLDVAGARIASVICFESTYESLVRGFVRAGAEIIVVTTNNASFGTSPAARQHLAASRLRAIEHGRAVVHAAIAGISAIVMPDGRIVQRADLFTPALLRATLPRTRALTPYARLGGALEILIGLAALVVVAAGVRARKEVVA